jgi:hypothetical protein
VNRVRRIAAEPRVNRTWVLLSGLTILGSALALARPKQSISASTAETLAVLAIAGVKSRLILRQFMEVRTAPRWLRRTTDVGLFVLLASLFLIYAFA